MKNLTLLITAIFISSIGLFAQTFYSKSTGGLNTLSTWGDNTDGTGAAPLNFTSAGQTFEIRNRATASITANWTVSGAGSAVTVGDGTNATNFSTGAFTITGTFNVSNTATLTVQSNSTTLTIGTCATGSTVSYGGNVDQSVRVGTYYNLVLTGATATRTKTASGNIVVNNDLTVDTLNTFALLTNLLSGTIISTNGSGVITTTNTSASPVPNGITWAPSLQFNGGTPHSVPNGTYTNLLIGGTTDIKTANGNIVVLGILNVTATNTLAMTTNILSGAFSNTGTGNISTTSATAAIPSGKTWTQTINYSLAGAQEVVSGIYAGFTTSGSGIKTVLANLIVNGTLTVGANTTLNLSTFDLSGSLPTITFGSTTTSILQTANTTATPIPSNRTWGGVVQYNSASNQTVVSGTFNSLNLSGGDRTVSNLDTLFVNGTLTTGSGTLTTTGSTIVFQGVATTQTIAIAGQTILAFDNIRFRGGANKTFSGSAADITVNGELNIAGGVSMNLGTHRLLFGGGISLQGKGRLNSAHLLNTNPIPTIVGVWPYRVTFSGTNMSVSPGIYDTLTISGNGIKTAQGNITVNDSLIIGATNSTLDMATFELLGAFTPGGAAGTIRTQNTGATPLPSGQSWNCTVNYNAPGNQTVVSAIRYRNLSINGGIGEKILSGNIKVNLTLTVSIGVIFDLATFSLDSVTTITNTGTIRTQNTSSDPIPSGKIIAATFEYNGAGAQTVVNGTYTNLNISGGNRTLSSLGDINISGTFTASSGSITGGTSNIRLTGAAQTIVMGATGNFHNFRALGTGNKTITASTGPLNLDGVLEVLAARTLVMNNNQIQGAFTTTGTGTITTTQLIAALPNGITWTMLVNYTGAANQEFIGGTYNRLTLSGTGPKVAAGNIVVDSALVSGTLAINMVTFSLGGSLLTRTGTGVFSTQCLLNAVPSGLTWTFSTFNYNSTVVQDVVPGTYINLNVNGGDRIFNGVISITGVFTANTGGATYTTTGSTIGFSGAAQTPALLTGFTFENLAFLGSGTKTISIPITVNSQLTILSGVTLSIGTQILSGTFTTVGTGQLSTTITGGPAIPAGITWTFVVAFTANANQNIPDGIYQGGLTLGGTGIRTKTMLADITVGGILNTGTGHFLALNGNQLTLDGTIDGTATGSIRGSATSEIIIAANASDAGNLLMDQTTPGTTNTLLNFTLSRNTGADAITIGNTLRVLNLVTITDGTLNGNGNLVFVSSSETQSAQLATVSGSGAVSEDFIVQRFIPGNSDRDWRFVASSVTTTNNISNNWQLQTFITGSGTGASSCPGVHTNGFDYTSNNANSLLFWNTSTQAWNSVASTNSTNLVAGTGYRFFYRGTRSQGCAALIGNGPAPADTTLIATGTLLTGTQNITCATGTGWTLVGNPYQANIDLDLVGRTNVGPIYYVYDPSFNNYRQYDASSGIGTGDFLGNGTLAPGQSIFVVSTGAGATLTFNESNKDVAATPAAMFKQTAKSDILRLKLETENNEIDQSLVAFNESSSWAKDIYDGPLFDESLSQIATYTDATPVPMGINKINYLNRGEFNTIYVDLSRALESNKTYNLILTEVATFAPGYKLSLVDMYTNKTVALNDDMSYAISTDENPDSKSSSRIQIKVENINGKTPTASALVLSSSLSTKGDVVLYPQPANEVLNLTIQSGNSQVKHILVQDITGRLFAISYDLTNTRDIAVDVNALPTGIYFITLQGETEKVTHKFVKQ